MLALEHTFLIAKKDLFTASDLYNGTNMQGFMCIFFVLANKYPVPALYTIPREKRTHYEAQFRLAAGDSDTHVRGNVARQFLMNFQVPRQDLAKLWSLADRDRDGALTKNEFCFFCHFATLKQQDPAFTLPNEYMVALELNTKYEELMEFLVGDTADEKMNNRTVSIFNILTTWKRIPSLQGANSVCSLSQNPSMRNVVH